MFQNDRTDYANGVVGFMRLGGASPRTTLKARESKAIYKGELNCKFDDSMLVYASATEGYRAGGTVS